MNQNLTLRNKIKKKKREKRAFFTVSMNSEGVVHVQFFRYVMALLQKKVGFVVVSIRLQCFTSLPSRLINPNPALVNPTFFCKSATKLQDHLHCLDIQIANLLFHYCARQCSFLARIATVCNTKASWKTNVHKYIYIYLRVCVSVCKI